MGEVVNTYMCLSPEMSVLVVNIEGYSDRRNDAEQMNRSKTIRRDGKSNSALIVTVMIVIRI